jgi:rhodanese-related sulfurtransferase
VNDQQKHYADKLAYEIDSWDLQAARQNGERIVVVDARSRQAFDAEHIPGAVSLPHRTMNEQAVARLDRDALYVTYCDGIGCNASTKGALNLARLGFQVKELIGGIDWWKRDGYPTEAGGGAAAAAGAKTDCDCG